MLLQGSQGQTGKQVGQNLTAGFGEYSDITITELMPRYYQQAYRRNVFYAANSAGGTSSIGLSATYVGGVCLSNPIGSGVNLVPLKVGFIWTVIATVVNGVGLAVGYNAGTNVTHTVALVPASTLVGTGPAPLAKADSSATLPTAPVYSMFLTATPTATTNPTTPVTDLEGHFLIPPGGYLCTVTTAASASAAVWASMSWMEIPQ